MKSRRVVFSRDARADLYAIYEWIAEAADPDTGLGYVGRIERFCHALANGSERGTRRDGVRPGLRTLGFERRVTIAFTVDEERVTVLRLLYAGRTMEPR